MTIHGGVLRFPNQPAEMRVYSFVTLFLFPWDGDEFVDEILCAGLFVYVVSKTFGICHRAISHFRMVCVDRDMVAVEITRTNWPRMSDAIAEFFDGRRQLDGPLRFFGFFHKVLLRRY